MWRKTIYNLESQFLNKRELFFESRQKLFAYGVVIERQIALFNDKQTVIYDNLKDDSVHLLDTWGYPGERMLYQAALEKGISSGNITISDEGYKTPKISLPEFSYRFEQENTKHLVLANQLSDWLRYHRQISNRLDYLGRENYPKLKDDFYFVIVNFFKKFLRPMKNIFLMEINGNFRK